MNFFANEEFTKITGGAEFIEEKKHLMNVIL